MLGTVGNRDSTVVGGVDKKNFEEEKLLKKIPKIFGVEKFLPGKVFKGKKLVPVSEITGTCAGLHSARVDGRHELIWGGGGMWRYQRVSCSRLDPVRKGSGESGEKNSTEVGVNWAVPSVPIRALTDQRLWARVGET